MHFNLISILVAVATINQTIAAGINCRGSNICGRAKTKDAIKQIAAFLRLPEFQECRIYKNGEHIACVSDTNALQPTGGFCLFLSNTRHGATGQEILELMDVLNNRKDDPCGSCGSIPYLFSESHGNLNDPSRGELTVNFVTNTYNPCPTGLC